MGQRHSFLEDLDSILVVRAPLNSTQHLPRPHPPLLCLASHKLFFAPDLGFCVSREPSLWVLWAFSRGQFGSDFRRSPGSSRVLYPALHLQKLLTGVFLVWGISSLSQLLWGSRPCLLSKLFSWPLPEDLPWVNSFSQLTFPIFLVWTYDSLYLFLFGLASSPRLSFSIFILALTMIIRD